MRSQPVLIIAEAGVNHNGDINMAKRLIDAAASAGADLVKFQTFNAEQISIKTAPKADYQLLQTDKDQTQFSMLKQLELTPRMHEELIDYCNEKKIGFFSTAFDIKSLDYLARLGLNRFKIPSGEITNLPYLRRIGQFGRPIIMSTGMATMDEIGAALEALERAGTPRSVITVLHCNTEYPTPMRDVNLLAMLSIANTFGVEIGYSDHTIGNEVAIAAVALGATVIEKHLTLDRGLPGPDHNASIEPDEFASMVRSIRNIESALGDGLKRPSLSETKNINIARKSLVAAKEILAGECFTPENVAVKRPGSGISPMCWDEIIGKQAKKFFSKDELIEL